MISFIKQVKCTFNKTNGAKRVRQVIKESLEPFSLYVFIMGDVTERTKVFTYRVGRMSHITLTKKTNRFTSFPKHGFLPSSCQVFPNRTTEAVREHPVNFTACCTPSAMMSVFLFEFPLSHKLPQYFSNAAWSDFSQREVQADTRMLLFGDAANYSARSALSVIFWVSKDGMLLWICLV